MAELDDIKAMFKSKVGNLTTKFYDAKHQHNKEVGALRRQLKALRDQIQQHQTRRQAVNLTQSLALALGGKSSPGTRGGKGKDSKAAGPQSRKKARNTARQQGSRAGTL